MGPSSNARLKIMEINYGHYPDGQFDLLAEAISLAPQMVDGASMARQNYATSHRDVLVGAALFAHDESRKRAGIFLGYNNTPRPGAGKFCAEMRAQHSASGFETDDMIVVVGPSDPEVIASINEHGRLTDTLVQCKPCRNMHTDDSLVICTFSEDLTKMQAWTGASVKKFFDEPVHKERRKDKRAPLPKQPQVIDLSKNPERYWADTMVEYKALEAKIRVSTERELRVARAAAAVRAMNIVGREAA